MRIGTGLIVAGLGAILRFAIDDEWDSVDLEAVGTILMVIGVVAFLTAVGLEFTKRRAVEGVAQSRDARVVAPPETGAPPATPTGSAPPKPQ